MSTNYIKRSYLHIVMKTYGIIIDF